jgi:hypothetical protein
MKPVAAFPGNERRSIRAVLTDIDDTLTDDGRLTARSTGEAPSMGQTRSGSSAVFARTSPYSAHAASPRMA